MDRTQCLNDIEEIKRNLNICNRQTNAIFDRLKIIDCSAANDPRVSHIFLQRAYAIRTALMSLEQEMERSVW